MVADPMTKGLTLNQFRVHVTGMRLRVARAIWFGCKWGLRTGNLQVSNNSDIVKLALEPPIAPHSADLSPKKEQEQNSLRMALTLEAIWNLRNQVLHKGRKVNILSVINLLEIRYNEFVQMLGHKGSITAPEAMRWQKPPTGTIKLNVDATLNKNSAWLGVVARDEKGIILKVWAKGFSNLLSNGSRSCCTLMGYSNC
uniref:RNase H type-1 domain-containing protein n=1 Tax=Fagus sylvatica TaxID=28930 RepID=A0A2N9I6C8_FAGSY